MALRYLVELKSKADKFLERAIGITTAFVQNVPDFAWI